MFCDLCYNFITLALYCRVTDKKKYRSSQKDIKKEFWDESWWRMLSKYETLLVHKELRNLNTISFSVT